MQSQSTIGKAKRLTNQELNSLVDVEYSDGKKLAVKEWVHLNRGNSEIYIGDQVLVVAFTNTAPADMDEVQVLQLRNQNDIIGYLAAEGFIKPNWVYLGLHNVTMQESNPFETEYSDEEENYL